MIHPAESPTPAPSGSSAAIRGGFSGNEDEGLGAMTPATWTWSAGLRRSAKSSPPSGPHGGNIIMVQLENEYGSYGDDQEYLELNRRIDRDGDATCRSIPATVPSQMPNGFLPDSARRHGLDVSPAQNADPFRTTRRTGPTYRRMVAGLVRLLGQRPRHRARGAVRGRKLDGCWPTGSRLICTWPMEGRRLAS